MYIKNKQKIKKIFLIVEYLGKHNSTTAGVWRHVCFFENTEKLLAQSSVVLSGLPACRDEYASSLCNRSALLLQLGRAEAAVPLLSEAITLYEQELGTDTPHYHAALNSLGLAKMALHDSVGATENFLNAVHAAEALYGPDHPETQALRHTLEVIQQPQEENK